MHTGARNDAAAAATVSGRLRGQIALVTGAASGIGRAIVLALAAEGAAVAMVDVDAPQLHSLHDDTTQRGWACTAHAFDLERRAGLAALVDGIHAEHGRLDILVNAAGITAGPHTLMDVDGATWDKVMAINLTAPMLLMQAAARHMVAAGRGGRIVNITSSSAFRAQFVFPAYGASKAGLTQLSRGAAAELGPHGINVNCVAPGVTVTPLLEKIQGLGGVQRLVESGPLANLLGRPSLPEDVAESVLFLCLPASRQITGQTLHTSAGAVV